jgi:glutathione S-transferase
VLTIWGRKTSSNMQALMWCVGELGLAYVRHDAGHRFGGLDTPDFLAMNPNGVIPVVRDGDGEPLWETGAILRYLAGRYGDGGSFWPADPVQRVRVDKWAEWAKLNVSNQFTVEIFWRVVRTAPRDRDPAAIRAAIQALGQRFDIAEARLAENRYLAGAEFSLADIQFGHILFRYFDIVIDRPDRPVLARYYRSLIERPAFREHVMVPYEELRVL